MDCYTTNVDINNIITVTNVVDEFVTSCILNLLSKKMTSFDYVVKICSELNIKNNSDPIVVLNLGSGFERIGDFETNNGQKIIFINYDENMKSVDFKRSFSKYNIIVLNIDKCISGYNIIEEIGMFQNESIDLILCSRFLEHICINNMPELFYEISRKLKSTGYFIPAVPNHKTCIDNIEYFSNYKEWYQAVNILNNHIFHYVVDDSGMLVDSHKSIWTPKMGENYLHFENNFKILKYIYDINIENQKIYIVYFCKKG